MNSEYKDHIHDVKSQFLCQVNQVNFPKKTVLMKVFLGFRIVISDRVHRRITLAQQSYRDAFILLSRKIWFARVATISSRVRHKNSPNFCFFIFHFRVTAILALTLLLTIGRISLELSWHCIHYKNLLVT